MTIRWVFIVTAGCFLASVVAETGNRSESGSAVLGHGLLKRVGDLESRLEAQELQRFIPVGTVIASTRIWEEMNESLQKTWLPCDGRPWHEDFNPAKDGNQLPDLRGVFLRGLNNFGLQDSQAPGTDGDRKDPLDSRQAGHFQEKSNLSHQHRLNGRIDEKDDVKVQWWNFTSLTQNVTNHRGFVWGNNAGENESNLSLTEKYPTATALSKPFDLRPINVAVYWYIKVK